MAKTTNGKNNGKNIRSFVSMKNNYYIVKDISHLYTKSNLAEGIGVGEVMAGPDNNGNGIDYGDVVLVGDMQWSSPLYNDGATEPVTIGRATPNGTEPAEKKEDRENRLYIVNKVDILAVIL